MCTATSTYCVLKTVLLQIYNESNNNGKLWSFLFCKRQCFQIVHYHYRIFFFFIKLHWHINLVVFTFLKKNLHVSWCSWNGSVGACVSAANLSVLCNHWALPGLKSYFFFHPSVTVAKHICGRKETWEDTECRAQNIMCFKGRTTLYPVIPSQFNKVLLSFSDKQGDELNLEALNHGKELFL